MKRWLWWVVAVAVLASVGFLIYSFCGRNSVEVALVSKKSGMVDLVKGTGEISLQEATFLRAPLTAQLEEVFVDEGGKVKAGQLLLNFAATEVNSSLEKAKANVKLAQAQLERAVSGRETSLQEQEAATIKLEQATAENERFVYLLDQGAVSRQEADAVGDKLKLATVSLACAKAVVAESTGAIKEAEAGLTVALTELAYQQKQAGLLDVLSPVQGTVVKRAVEEGCMVNQGDILLELGDPHNLLLTLLVAPQDLPRVQLGQKVKILPLVGDFPEAQGVVSDILPGGKLVTSSLGVEEAKGVVEITFQSNDCRFRSGYKVRGEIQIVKPDEVLVLPEEAVVSTAQGDYVFVVNERQILKKRIVECGLRTHGLVEIKSGLKEGEKIVKNPGDELKNGEKVTLKN